ncbi:MAG: hypothetical protein WC354_06930 [Candidatus Omnitrophota bacterium]
MMEFADVKAVVKSINSDSVRADADDYLEVVILKSNMEALISKLNGLFGAPVWPPENKLPGPAQQAISQYGGIQSGQTLYFYQQNGAALFVMFWPWGNGQQITIKSGKK